MKIDGKFSCDGKQIFNSVSGEIIPPDEPLMLFRARDELVYAMLLYYRSLAIGAGCDDTHMASIDRNLVAFASFGVDYPDRMKQPGSTRDVEL